MKRYQSDWSSIKILAKDNTYCKRRSKGEYFITKHKDKATLLNKKNEFKYMENGCIVLRKFLTQGK